ncbi:hypothetical protein SAMN05428970_0303 [Agromyces sp. CF514]|nr:hypothetical protein SAMN05428970_0303 [Agromyces sp. CF514]
MFVFLIALAVLAVAGVASTFVDLSRDGYRRTPTLAR